MNHSSLAAPVSLLRRIHAFVRELNTFLRMERQRSWRRGFFDPRLLLRGFFSQRRSFYPLDRYPPALFINDWKVEFRFGQINPPNVQPFTDNKLLFHLYVRQRFPERVTAALIGLVVDDSFVPLSPAGDRSDPALPAAALAETGFLIVKGITGNGGKNVRRLDRWPCNLGPGTFLLESGIRQHPYAAAINPASVNTVRIVTMKCPDSGAYFVAWAVHRFGTHLTGCVDSVSQGGLTAAIDGDTGMLSAAKSNPGVYARDRHSCHPDSGAPIEGVRVPFWSQAQELCLAVAAALPEIVHLAWDVAITETGPVLIEGNAGVTNPNLIQTHRPILSDERIRRFYEHQGLVSPRQAQAIARFRRRCSRESLRPSGLDGDPAKSSL